MKFLHVIMMGCLMIIGIACKQEKKDNLSAPSIPALINRPHLIGPEQEMSATMDSYQQLVDRIKTNPSDHSSRLAVAELFMQEARISGEHGYYYPAAMKIIEAVIAEKPEAQLEYRALADLGSVQLSQHQFTAAKLTAERALSLNEHSADIYGVLIDANVELGDYAKAVEYADRMISIRPDIRSYSRISYLREIHGDVDGALEAMKMAVAAGYPGTEQTEWARLTLGHLYERYGMLDSAFIQYGQSLAYRPNYPFAIAAMAQVHAAKGEHAKADSLNSVAMNLIPEVSFYVSQAEWEKEKGNTAASEKLTKKIMDMLADDEASGHLMSLEYAHVYFHLKNDAKQALQSLQKEYVARPENIDVSKRMAEVYLYQGDIAKASEHLAKAQRTGSVDPELRVLEGMLMVKSNQQAEGTALIQSVFAENPHLNCIFCDEAKSILL